MPYNSIISRTDSAALVPEDVGALITRGVGDQSAAMSLFRRVNLSRNQQRVPVLSALPTAYFVSGDTGLKQTTEMAWANKYLNVEELAAIVPIPEAVLDDTSYDVWGEVRPRMEEAIARALDAAVFFGSNKPASWPNDLQTDMAAKAATVNRGTNNAAAGLYASDLSDAFSVVEADGYDVNGVIAKRTWRGYLRKNRTTTGENNDPNVSPTEAFGVAIQYPMRGLWGTASGSPEVIVGDFSQGIFGVRQDYTYKVLTEAVITDNTGAIIYNLAQQDMVALRVVARYAWQMANIINYDNTNDATRYPFAAVVVP
jgi:HK97 family phage major capsid protein